jgi:hypothetical protein
MPQRGEESLSAGARRRRPLRAVSRRERASRPIDLGAPRFATGTKASSLSAAEVTQLVLNGRRRIPRASSRCASVKGLDAARASSPGYVTSQQAITRRAAEPAPGRCRRPVPPRPCRRPIRPGGPVPLLQQRSADLSVPPASEWPWTARPVADPVARDRVPEVAKARSATGLPGPARRRRSRTRAAPRRRTPQPGIRFEVLLDRQLALYIESGASSGRCTSPRAQRIRDAGRPLQRLPQGGELLVGPVQGLLPWASYFVGGVAFHESPDVPAQAGLARLRPRAALRREVGLRPRARTAPPVTVLGSSR